MLTLDELRERQARKRELDALVPRIAQSNRYAAKLLGVKESTLRGWRDKQELKRAPSEEVLRRARELVETHGDRELDELLETGS
jgi:phosphoserine phosphatase